MVWGYVNLTSYLFLENTPLLCLGHLSRRVNLSLFLCESVSLDLVSSVAESAYLLHGGAADARCVRGELTVSVRPTSRTRSTSSPDGFIGRRGALRCNKLKLVLPNHLARDWLACGKCEFNRPISFANRVEQPTLVNSVQ